MESYVEEGALSRFKSAALQTRNNVVQLVPLCRNGLFAYIESLKLIRAFYRCGPSVINFIIKEVYVHNYIVAPLSLGH